MSGNRTVTVIAPAKINLGLEILGKRDDGYHEVRSILATIGLSDTLVITLIPDREGTIITGVDGVNPQDNLILKAIAAFAEETGIRYGYDISVQKRIPSPGGLGGASSNAASTLMALNGTHGTPLPTDRMLAVAARLGSDVPFFIGPPVALASGTGTTLRSLKPINGYIVLVVPRIRISAKTARLYGLLEPGDFTDGSRVERAAEQVLIGQLPAPDLLHNAFTRPLYELLPELREVWGTIMAAGATHVALSGAGPAHYVPFGDRTSAENFAEVLGSRLSGNPLIATLPIHASPVSVDLVEP